jgi:mRNA interferase YafQ
MLIHIFTNHFKKDYALMQIRNSLMQKIDVVILYLVNEIVLPVQYKEHSLHGNYEGYLECHIEPNWLFYEIDSEGKTI